MIRINIELWPFGIEAEKRSLGEVRLWNDCTGTPNRGNYRWKMISRNGRTFRCGSIKNWPRKARSIWKLVEEVFSA